MSRIASRLSPGEALLLALLAAWSLIPLGSSVGQLIADGDVLGGTDGLGVVDHFQYLAWIREAGEHALVSNRYDLVSDDPVYLQPMWLVSGLLWAAGMPIQAGLLIWKPVCVVVLFAGCAAYVRRMVEGRGARQAALALALFYLPPTTALLGRTALGDDTADFLGNLFAVELSPATYLWGYVQTAVAVGLMPLFLLALERRRTWLAAASGLLVAWVHPWQGMVLLGIVAGAALWDRRRETLARLALPAAATLAPLVYFLVLARIDEAWGEGSELGGVSHQWGWMLLALAPLAAFAVAGVLERGRELDLQERMLILWPLVTLAVYAALDRTFFYNALSGITIPLAVLAVRGGRRMPAALAVAAVAIATVPGLTHIAWSLREGVGAEGSPRYLEPGEADALEFVDDSPRPGGVLTRLYLGQAVPGLSGRRTYVGHPSWTPHFGSRVDETELLFSGAMPPARARALVARTGVAFVIQDCVERRDLGATLGPLVRRTHRFGCATVYEVG